MTEKRPIAIIDAETDPFKQDRVPEPFIWGFYDGEGPVKYFEKTTELMAFLEPRELIVYAHNGGRFDYHLGILKYLEPYSGITLINNRLAKFKVGNCEFRDSFNILPIPLQDFRKDEIEYWKLERKFRRKYMPEIKRYLATDCTALYELVSKFRNTYGTGLTLAGSAMKFWRQLSGHDSVSNSDSMFFSRFKPFYTGGRVQVFRPGIIKEPFNVVDINSAYPFAMLHDHPFSRSFEAVDNVSKKAKIDPCSMYVVQGKALRGFAPVRRDCGSVHYPSDGGSYRLSITGWELLAGIETDSFSIEKIQTRYDFPVRDNFRNYIEHFYTQKKASPKNSPEYIFAKLFMNSLYGKFGADPDNYDSFGIVPIQYAEAAETDPDLQLGSVNASWYADYDKRKRKSRKLLPRKDRSTGRWEAIGHLGPWALMRAKLYDDQKFYYNVATAASITGFVRAYLWRHLDRVRASGGTLYYCDTDSVAFSGNMDVFTCSKNLGDWSSEGDFIRGGIGGKKLYAFERRKGTYSKPEDRWKTAHKGAKLTPAEIMRIARGGKVQYESDVPSFSPVKPVYFVKRQIQQTF